MTRQTYASLSRELTEFLQQEGVNLTPKDIQLRKLVLRSLDEIVTKWALRVYQTCRKQGGLPNVKDYNLAKLLPQGSYYLQTDDPTSDIDVIVVTSCCIRRRSHFFGHHSLALQNMLQQDERVAEVVAICSASVPLLRFRFYGIDVDMGMCQLQHAEITDHLDYGSEDLIRNWVADEESRKTLGGWRSTIAIRDLWEGNPQSTVFRNYKLVVRLLKFWAKRRGLYSNVMGFFGGINISILVGRILQTNSVHTTPAEMILKFFKTYDCEWGNTFGLFPFEGSQHVLDPSYSGHWHQHSMKIITPTIPQINSSSNVFPSSLAVIQQEIQRGKKICQQIVDDAGQAGRISWKDLTEPFNFWSSYEHFLQLSVSVSNKSHLAGWQGKVISKIRKLAIDLQHLVGLVRPWTFPVCKLKAQGDQPQANDQSNFENHVMYYLSLEKNPEEINKGYFDNVIRNFRQSIISEYQDERCHRSGMDISIEVVSQQELPTDCFSESNSIDSIGQRRLGDVEWAIQDAAINSIISSKSPHTCPLPMYSRNTKRWFHDRHQLAAVPWIHNSHPNAHEPNNQVRNRCQDMTAHAVARQVFNSQVLLNSIRSVNNQQSQLQSLEKKRAALKQHPITSGAVPSTQQKGTSAGVSATQAVNSLFLFPDPLLVNKQLKQMVHEDLLLQGKHNNAKSKTDLQDLFQGRSLSRSSKVQLRRSPSDINIVSSDNLLLKDNINANRKRQALDLHSLDSANLGVPKQVQCSQPKSKFSVNSVDDESSQRNLQEFHNRISGYNQIRSIGSEQADLKCAPASSEVDRDQPQRLSILECSLPQLKKQYIHNFRSTSYQTSAQQVQNNKDKLTYAQVLNLMASSRNSGECVQDESLMYAASTEAPSLDEVLEQTAVTLQIQTYDNHGSSDELSSSTEEAKIASLQFPCLDDVSEANKVKVTDLLSILNRSNCPANDAVEILMQPLSRQGSGSVQFSELTDQDAGAGARLDSGKVVLFADIDSRQTSQNKASVGLTYDTTIMDFNSGEDLQQSSQDKASVNIAYNTTVMDFNSGEELQQLQGECISEKQQCNQLNQANSSEEELSSEVQVEFSTIDELKYSILGSFSVNEFAVHQDICNNSDIFGVNTLEQQMNQLDHQQQCNFSQNEGSLKIREHEIQTVDIAEEEFSEIIPKIQVIYDDFQADNYNKPVQGEFQLFMKNVPALPERCETYRSKRNEQICYCHNKIEEEERDEENSIQDQSEQKAVSKLQSAIHYTGQNQMATITTVSMQSSTGSDSKCIATIPTKGLHNAKPKRCRRDRKHYRNDQKRQARKVSNQDEGSKISGRKDD